MLKRGRLSISKKLTLLYSSILLSILVAFSALTMVSIRSFIINDSKAQLSSNAEIISNYILTLQSVNSESFRNLSLSNGIYYSILDDSQNTIYSNMVIELPAKGRRQEKGLNRKDAFDMGEGTISINRAINVNGKTYYLLVAKNFEDIGGKTGDITAILITITILGTIVSFLAGSFLTKRFLKPIKDITAAAKEITSKSLDKRITTNGAKDELSELADTFNSMIERLEIDFEKQKRFVSDASHELRTPLAVIHGHVNMLNRWGKDDPEQLGKSLKTLKAETESMNRLIENLLFIAKGDNDALIVKKDEFQLDILLKEIVDETRLSFSHADISYQCSHDLQASADYNKLKQVLRILIDNSIKFSKDKPKIVIEAKELDKELQISVADNGIGIPKESLDKIFDRFYRVDESRTKTTGGTGLGLSIAKQIVQSHGGRITAKSIQGQGTAINIWLPA